jgi:ribosomal protein S18 acetylase RimI-like enzyme
MSAPLPHCILPASITHLDGMLHVQQQTFTEDLRESANVFRNRFTRFGDCFRVALQQELVVGYMLCFPWKLGESPVNNQPFPDTLPLPDCFYIHDITLLPQARGTGIARAMLQDAFAQARLAGFDTMSLVAVAQSGDYWDKAGFTTYPALPAQKHAALLEVYGPGARLMVKPVE